MAARAAVVSLLENDSQITALGFGAVYPGNAVDTPAEDRFLVVRWEPKVRSFGLKGTDRFSVWAHDRDRSYLKIDRALKRAEDLLSDSVQVLGADGWVLTCAEWNSESPDLRDDGYGTVTRYSDFTAVSRYTGV